MVEVAPHEVAFGEFRLLPARRLLLSRGKPVRVGSRAFDLLLALIEQAGELVGKDELVARVWPNTFVDETNLRVHIAALRKLLGEGAGDDRFLRNEPGRGYRFVAPVTISDGTDDAGEEEDELAGLEIPLPLARVVGRDDIVESVAARLSRDRFLTIVGAAGIGKSTVALLVAEHLADQFVRRVHYADLATVRDTGLALGAVAIALGLPVRSHGSVEQLAASIPARPALLVLDGCEGAIDIAAGLCEALLKGAPAIHVVATSREPLRAEGETVVRLGPLGLPPEGTAIGAGEARLYPAVELFVERAAAIVDGYGLSDADAPVVCEICRRLDGIPLAIELAAGRIDAFGVNGVAELLGDRFRLLTSGRRRALPRHQTLEAAFDWSYDLLSPAQAAMFRRLAILVGGFGLETAVAIGAGSEAGGHENFSVFASLVAKSLVTADVGGRTTIYRLLDSTRSYALRKLDAGGELPEVAAGHATHFLELLTAMEADWSRQPRDEQIRVYWLMADNVRAALDWAFSPGGDPELGASLTAAAIVMWMHLSLVAECSVRAEQALAFIESQGEHGSRRAMQLHAALGHSLMFTRGAVDETVAALTRAFEIAEQLGDTEYALRTLWGIWVGRLNNGAIPGALDVARRFAELARSSPDPLDLATADRMIGFSLHFLGRNSEARFHMERMLGFDHGDVVHSQIYRFQFDLWSTARATLAESLWIQGFADRALAEARRSTAEAMALGHAVTTCNTLAKASAVALHCGALGLAEEMIDTLRETASRNLLAFWLAEAGCLAGVCRIERGDLEGGLALLRTNLHGFPGSTLTVRYVAYLGKFADALSQAGDHAAATAAITEALERAERNSELWCLAELLRLRGEIVLRAGGADAADRAAELFESGLRTARDQDAVAWELRSAVSLARLEQSLGRHEHGAAKLRPVRARFSEGFDSADVRAADLLLNANL